MKDKLRELAKEMRNELCGDFAQKLEAILDAEGDGGVVGDAKEYLDNCVNALDHIARTARNCRVTSKRLTWIASRAESAINSNDAWRDAPVPKNGASALLRAKARIKELEAAITHPARSGVASDDDVRDAARYREQMSKHYIRYPSQLLDMVRYANQFRPDWWMDKESWDAGIDFAIDAAIQGERHER